MIGIVRGQPIEFENGVMLLLCTGVGYEINVNEQPILNITRDYWTHVHYPDQGAPSMWGFRGKSERDLFRRLLQIDNVGCKVAMRAVPIAMKFTGPVAHGIDYVSSELQKAKGIGPKLARRIAEELNK